MIQRRQTLHAVAAALLWPSGIAWSKSPPVLRPVTSTEPLAHIAAGGPSGLLGVSVKGVLWALALDGRAPQRLGEGLDPDTPLALGHGRIAARRQDGALWVYESGRSAVSVERTLAPYAGLLVLPLAVIAVVANAAQHRLARLEPHASGAWQRVAGSDMDVLPDARPMQADPDGAGDGGHVVVLAGPNSERYRHGVLGDGIEATRMLLLERHSLAPMRELVLDAPWVFEDIAPRVVKLAGARDGLLTVQAGPSGGQLVLVDADPNASAALRVAARGPALGTANRWMSPIVCGPHWLAVHTPHIGGVLHAYRREGSVLEPRRMLTGVSNHRIGSRRLDMSACSAGEGLWMPDQAGRRLLWVDAASDGRVLGEVTLTSKVVAAVSLSAAGMAAVLQDDGVVSVLTGSS
jgi:hypothetical protein